MTGTDDESSAPTPKHLWIVGVISLLWGAMGAFDYLMTQTHNASYMSQFTPEQLEFYYGFPVWVDAAWAIAVWGGLLGSVLLLLRKCLAVPVFLVSLVAMVAVSVHNYGFADGLAVMGGAFPLIFTAVIFIVSVSLWLYARAMSSRGVLR